MYYFEISKDDPEAHEIFTWLWERAGSTRKNKWHNMDEAELWSCEIFDITKEDLVELKLTFSHLEFRP